MTLPLKTSQSNGGGRQRQGRPVSHLGAEQGLYQMLIGEKGGSTLW